ncbi:MAG TPA: hypothetical protein DCY13_24190, partial [Verrucomicrobiales bacterium]|nr:hypothetical protein [Verrucomicrobiales bacterium]
GIYGLFLDPTYRPPAGAPNAGETYHLENQWAAIPQFFSTYAAKDLPLTYGLGIYSPFGGRASWPQETGFRTVSTEGSVTDIAIHPAIAWKITSTLSLGTGITVNYAKIDLEQGLLRTPRPFPNYFRFVGDGWRVGYNVGVLWQPVDEISLGATFRSATTLRAEGRTEFEQQPVIQPTERDATTEYEFPLTVTVGISYRPTPDWNLEFNADYADWSSFGKTTIRQRTPPPFPVLQNIDVTLGWQSSWIYAFGVTRILRHGWQVSGGYAFSENSVPDHHYTPLAADLDRHVFSVGTGRRGKRIGFDVAYQFAYGPARTVSGSTPPSQPAQFAGQSADGRYEFFSHGLLVTGQIDF